MYVKRNEKRTERKKQRELNKGARKRQNEENKEIALK